MLHPIHEAHEVEMLKKDTVKGATSQPSNFLELLADHSPLLQPEASKSFKIPAMKIYKWHLGPCNV
jgi:hypothetical protein